MDLHRKIWKKVLIVYLVEVFYLLLLISVLKGKTFWGYSEILIILVCIPFILNAILASRWKLVSIRWRIFYALVLSLIIWPLAFLTSIKIGLHFGILWYG